MQNNSDNHGESSPGNDFDVIIIGSGICGATLARELCKQQQKVLILERGRNTPLKESFIGIATIAEQVFLGEGKLSTIRAITTGGSTSMYFGVVNYPPLDVFRAVGIDLAADLEAVKKQLPIAQLPDALLSAQAKKLRDSANALGYRWQKNDMLVDLSKCEAGYAYEAKWKAKTWVEQAVQDGATLVTRATVLKVIVENKVAIGVEYQHKSGMFGSQVKRVFARKIIVAAGETASPKLLRDSGVSGVGDRGFYCNPGAALFGLVPGLNGGSGFVGAMSCALEDGVELGDANMPKLLYRPMMLGGMKLRHLFAHPDSIGIGIKVKDQLGGELRPDGRFYKGFEQEDLLKIEKGRQEAVKILKQAGALHIIEIGLTAAGRVGGLLRIGEHVDAQLETQFRNLYVCDGSVIPDEMRGTPSVTLVCMARRLARHILATM